MFLFFYINQPVSWVPHACCAVSYMALPGFNGFTRLLSQNAMLANLTILCLATCQLQCNIVLPMLSCVLCVFSSPRPALQLRDPHKTSPREGSNPLTCWPAPLLVAINAMGPISQTIKPIPFEAHLPSPLHLQVNTLQLGRLCEITAKAKRRTGSHDQQYLEHL